MSKVLVTGGTGFLGRHLVETLLSDGHEVVSLVYGQEPSSHGSLTEVSGNVLDGASVERAARGCEAIFHCAGKVSRDPKDAELLHRIHVEGTKITLDAARAAGIKRAIVASTSGVVAVSKKPKPIPDERSLPPMELIGSWPYYRTKLFAEMAAFERNAPDFTVVCVNPSLLLGPGDILGSSTGDVVDFLEKRIPAIPGGGMSFVDARDAARGLVLALEHGKPGERYLLAAQNLTMRAFCEKLSRISGVPMPVMQMPKSPAFGIIGATLAEKIAKRLNTEPLVDKVSAEMAQYFWYADSTKARTELGWEPRDPMDTLADTVEDLRSRGVVWPAA
jgi:dihydroflavonol-4-reductase